jgi:bilirubin oxidase
LITRSTLCLTYLGRSAFDGFAKDLISTGEYKDYYFPNTVARTLWYHDHTNGKNAVNMYKGLAGMYQIIDPALDASLGIPSGTKYDVPLILTSHYFTPSGALSDESKATTSTYGDTILVNGQIQPYLAVEPRKYRFRLLNAATSRAFNITLRDSAAIVPMSVIGSDGGFLQSPTNAQNLIMGMADRWEVILDFSPFSGKNVTLTTKNMWTDTAYTGMDDVLRFVVDRPAGGENDNERAIRPFKIDLKFPSDVQVAAERTIVLQSHMDTVWGLNSFHMDDAMSRVMMRPPLGTLEKYTFKSAGMGMFSGGKTGSSDPLLKPVSGSTSNGMGGMMGGSGGMMGGTGGSMAGHHGGRKRVTRQMSGMMGGSGNSGQSMTNSGWTHAIHLHLVVSTSSKLNRSSIELCRT